MQHLFSHNLKKPLHLRRPHTKRIQPGNINPLILIKIPPQPRYNFGLISLGILPQYLERSITQAQHRIFQINKRQRPYLIKIKYNKQELNLLPKCSLRVYNQPSKQF